MTAMMIIATIMMNDDFDNVDEYYYDGEEVVRRQRMWTKVQCDVSVGKV